MSKILVVDDEVDICEILEFNLRNEGYEVDIANSAEEALEQLSPSHNLILLDVMMEGMSGFHMADKLRKSNNYIPIIFLTAKDTENDMLTGFSIGGDDYISKPFSIKEVIARVRSILKRSSLTQQHQRNSSTIEVTGLRIDLISKEVYIDNIPVSLTKTEYNILTLLATNPNTIYSRADILDKAWKDDGIVLERTVDVHITRLRKKMGDYGTYIINRTGYGYSFVPREE